MENFLIKNKRQVQIFCQNNGWDACYSGKTKIFYLKARTGAAQLQGASNFLTFHQIKHLISS